MAACNTSLTLYAVHRPVVAGHCLIALQGWWAASSPHQEWARGLDRYMHPLGLDRYLHPQWLSHPQPRGGSPDRQQDLHSSSRHLRAKHR